jgi:hypothetical protein
MMIQGLSTHHRGDWQRARHRAKPGQHAALVHASDTCPGDPPYGFVRPVAAITGDLRVN